MNKGIQAPDISFVVARSYPQNIIGCDNQLPWRLKGDLKRFREITTGHAVIMGRKTYESIGRPLPNRKNIVISRSQDADSTNRSFWDPERALYWATTRENALFIADALSITSHKRDIFVIGGAEIYKLFADLYYKIYLTLVFTGKIDGDATFDISFENDDGWKLIEEQECAKSEVDEYPSRFYIYKKKKYNRRYVNPRDFLKIDPLAEKWLLQHLDEIEKANLEHQESLNLFDQQLTLAASR